MIEDILKPKWEKEFDDKFTCGDWEQDEYGKNVYPSKELKAFIKSSISKIVKELEPEFNKLEDRFSEEYDKSLKEEEMGENNAYAHGLAIVKDTHNQYLSKVKALNL